MLLLYSNFTKNKNMSMKLRVPSERFELPTSRLQGMCSNHLSYKDMDAVFVIKKQPKKFFIFIIRGTKTFDSHNLGRHFFFKCFLSKYTFMI